MVSNAYKLDPALVQRVTRDCTPGSYLATPVSDHTPLAFDRTSSFGLGPEHSSSVPLEGIPSFGPVGALSAPNGAPVSVAAAAAASTAVQQRGMLQHSTDAAPHPRSSFSCTASITPRTQQRKSEGGMFDNTPTASEAFTPVASLRHRRHSTALSGRSITTESLIPATSQQEFSPMGTSAFPAGLLCPSKHLSSNTRPHSSQDPRAASSGSLPPYQHQTDDSSAALTLAVASPWRCSESEDSANKNVLETGCDSEHTQHESHKRAVDSTVEVPGDLEGQQRRLPPVKLPSRSSTGRTTADLLTDVAAADSVGSSMVVSPGYQAPRSWDSDEMMRSTAGGGVKLVSSEEPVASLPPASAALESSNDRAYQEELDRLIT